MWNVTTANKYCGADIGTSIVQGFRWDAAIQRTDLGCVLHCEGTIEVEEEAAAVKGILSGLSSLLYWYM